MDGRIFLLMRSKVGSLGKRINSSFFVNQGYTKAVLKLLSADEFVRQYMLQVALYIAAHYGNVDLVSSSRSDVDLYDYILGSRFNSTRCSC